MLFTNKRQIDDVCMYKIQTQAFVSDDGERCPE